MFGFFRDLGRKVSNTIHAVGSVIDNARKGAAPLWNTAKQVASSLNNATGGLLDKAVDFLPGGAAVKSIADMADKMINADSLKSAIGAVPGGAAITAGLDMGQKIYTQAQGALDQAEALANAGLKRQRVA